MIPSSISDYLARNGVRYSVMSHPTAYTAQQEAAASHVSGGEWAKSVVCMADDRPVLAVLPAPRAIDLDRLQQALHAHSIRLAREAEFGGLYKDCELGAMPPLGPLFGQPVVVDRTLTANDHITFDAGSHHEAIRMAYREFERLVQPAVAEFATGPAAGERQDAVLFLDPVCGAEIQESAAVASSSHAGETLYFCSLSCKMEFDDNPQAYMGRRT